MSTNKTYLPVEDAIKWKEFQARYLSTTDDEIERIARNLGYANRRGLVGAMRGKGIRRVNKAPDTGLQQEPLVVNLPPVKLKSYKPIKIKGKGDAVICPHTMTQHFQNECPDEMWLDGCIELLKRADAIFLCV